MATWLSVSALQCCYCEAENSQEKEFLVRSLPLDWGLSETAMCVVGNLLCPSLVLERHLFCSRNSLRYPESQKATLMTNSFVVPPSIWSTNFIDGLLLA